MGNSVNNSTEIDWVNTGWRTIRFNKTLNLQGYMQLTIPYTCLSGVHEQISNVYITGLILSCPMTTQSFREKIRYHPTLHEWSVMSEPKMVAVME